MLNDDFKHKMKNLNLPRTKWGDTLLANLFVGLLDLWMSSSDPRWTTELAEMAGNETNDFRSRLASGKLRSWLTEEVESWYSLMDGLPTKSVGYKVKLLNVICIVLFKILIVSEVLFIWISLLKIWKTLRIKPCSFLSPWALTKFTKNSNIPPLGF